jgi:succinate-semialdehyde dehydrogenase / glutarate-semialdehyde dehydrogenase
VAIGAVLTESTVVRKLSFTGSTAVGRTLAAQCAPTLKKLSLELGGNAPFIVMDDADLDAAVEGAVASKFRNSGQTCVCANRFLVQSGVYDEFARRLCVAVERLQVGPGLEDAVTQGPLIDGVALRKVHRLVKETVAAGARVLCGGAPHALGGNFFAPTVLVGVDPGMPVSQQEIFGPVAALIRFDQESEAVQLANASEAGLAAYVYTRDATRLWRIGAALQVGMVGLNTGVISTAVAPFGGVKQSGTGREGARQGLLDYTELKTLCVAV